MKVVINKCYGGFGLSNEAVKQLVLKGAKCVETMTPKHYFRGDALKEICYDSKWEEKWQRERATELEGIGEGFLGHKHNFYIYKDGLMYSFYDDYLDRKNRADSDLISVVKSLGSKANGNHAKLSIITIPDGVDFTVEEYDGMERIAERHRTWP